MVVNGALYHSDVFQIPGIPQFQRNKTAVEAGRSVASYRLFWRKNKSPHVMFDGLNG